MSNRTLVNAKKSPNDSWYTTYDDVARELECHVSQFAGKRVLCNADDPIESAFTCYFVTNFKRLGLRSLTCVAYHPSHIHQIYSLQPPSPIWRQIINWAGAYVIHISQEIGTRVYPIDWNGGFDSPFAEPLWEDADIICTNPPFSRFKDFFGLIQQHHKSYLLLCNLQAITFTTVFPQVLSGAAKIGYNWGSKRFRVPEGESYNWKHLGTAVWLTDLPVDNPIALELSCRYSPALYPHYDNYDAIHVDKVANIPVDYDGIMGVPITYIRYHHPSSGYELVGQANHGTSDSDLFMPYLNGKRTFKRLLIRRVSSQQS